MSRSSLAFLAVVASAAGGARAHEVSAEVDQRDGAVAVRVGHPGDGPLADARYEVRSPRGGELPFAEGTTDRHGWLAFTPDVPGRWEVRIADASGHGRTVEVQVAEARAAAPRVAEGEIEVQVQPAERDGDGGGGSTLRVLAGITAILVVFRVLLAVQRARRARGP